VNERTKVQTSANDDFDRVWEIVKEIGATERHFNQLQHQYRVLASTWILAVFAATGFILANEQLALGVPKEIAIVGLAVFGSFGITLLWILDLRVYGMLLRACFNVGLTLEEWYPWSPPNSPWLPPNRPWLPPIRSEMLRSQNYRGAAPFMARFYVGAIGVVLALGGVFLLLWSYRAGGLGWVIIALVLTGLFIFAWCYYLYNSTLKLPPLRTSSSLSYAITAARRGLGSGGEDPSVSFPGSVPRRS
jgi:hypothetical protein